MQGVAETARKGRDVFQKILRLRTETENSLLDLGKRAIKARALLLHLYRRPMVTGPEVETLLKVSRPTANALIKDLIDRGILVESTGRLRGRLYAFERYLKLFME